MATVAPPTTEKGYVTRPNRSTSWWASDGEEQAPELRWPLSIPVYDRMRRSDAQVASVLRAVTLPVRRTTWRVDPAGATDEVATMIAADLGLPLVGEADVPDVVGRPRDRFSWAEHLRMALFMLAFGHMFFEQVVRIDESGMVRLRKLGPRMPRTLRTINVADDGGLVSIEQHRTNFLGRSRSSDHVIPVDRLVAYVHEREGGNWLGSSLLRPAYKHWVIKDRLLRVQAQTIDRNGMGVPVYTGAPGEEDLTKGVEMASAMRSGDNAGAAIPQGATLELKGVTGRLPDADPAIRYHDEQIARAVLAHFLNLGTQTGSWALGSTFADFFVLSLQALAEQIADTATQHIVEDLVDWNFGPDEPAPRIVFDEIGSRSQFTAQAMKALVDAGVIEPDDVLEEAIRQMLGLPSKGANAAGSAVAAARNAVPVLDPPPAAGPTDLVRMAEAIHALAGRETPVTVNLPEISVVPPVINVTTPDVHAHIENRPPEVTVNLPEMVPQVVNVTTPDVYVDARTTPEVHVAPAKPPDVFVTNTMPEARAVTKTIERDVNGHIAKIVEE